MRMIHADDTWDDIDETNREGSKRSGINTSIRPRPKCRPRRDARGSGPDTSVDTDRAHFPQGWSCFYHIFQYLNGVLN